MTSIVDLIPQEVPSIRLLDLDSTTSGYHANMVYRSHQDIYQDISVVKPLTSTKSPVYLITSRATKLNYAMKVFVYNHSDPQIYFENARRFAGLRHQNVLKTLYFQKKREAVIDGLRANVSYTVMEYVPHGDFTNFFKKVGEEINEKIVRTYFKQLIEGLEYLHGIGVAHMDLKPENLLLSNDFVLKIGGLEKGHYGEDALIISQGTKGYRAPEMIHGKCIEPRSADIYSAGIILFTLMTKGMAPHKEKTLVNGMDFADLLNKNPHKFWSMHLSKSRVSFSADFKELFMSMVNANSESRATIETIKASSWYNGPILSQDELKLKMGTIFSSCPNSQETLSTVA